jgi:uncharacterized protein (DUF2237 family)
MNFIKIVIITLLPIIFLAKNENKPMVKTSKLINENVKGEALETCCTNPMTGFYRNGKCETGANDYGTHVVCAEMTDAFLDFTKLLGNDLSTPRPEYSFPGLKAGDKWCLCALRWKEADRAGFAPPVILESTHKKALDFIELEDLKKNSK